MRDVARADNGPLQGRAGGVVTVSVTNGDGSAVLSVRNDGPVPDPTQRSSTRPVAGANGARAGQRQRSHAADAATAPTCTPRFGAAEPAPGPMAVRAPDRPWQHARTGRLGRPERRRVDLRARAEEPDPVANEHEAGRALIHPSGQTLHVDCVVALPQLSGPPTPGVPGGSPAGFISIDPYCKPRGGLLALEGGGGFPHSPALRYPPFRDPTTPHADCARTGAPA